MICPQCCGRGGRTIIIGVVGVGVCDYPGCVDGIVDCCDGLMEQPDSDPGPVDPLPTPKIE